MDWTLVVAWSGVVIALGALVVSYLAFRQNAKHYPKPALIDESAYRPSEPYPWHIAVRNVGNENAHEMTATVLSLRTGESAIVAENGIVQPGREFGQYFSLNETDPSEVWLTVSWRQGPDFERMRTRKVRVPKHGLRQRLQWLRLRMKRDALPVGTLKHKGGW